MSRRAWSTPGEGGGRAGEECARDARRENGLAPSEVTFWSISMGQPIDGGAHLIEILLHVLQLVE